MRWCSTASSTSTTAEGRDSSCCRHPTTKKYCASALGRVATGPNAGRPLRRLGDRIAATNAADFEGPRCVNLAGISLHANVCVPARDRRRLERSCRYAARPPLSTERLSLREDGRLQYRLRHRWRDGTTHMLFEGVELIERLAALVPPPRFNTVRYHGILAPAASCRDRVVPRNRTSPDTDSDREPREMRHGRRGCAGPQGDSSPVDSLPTESSLSRPRRLSWSELTSPRACSGLMYAAVPISMPAPVICAVNVGEWVARDARACPSRKLRLP